MTWYFVQKQVRIIIEIRENLANFSGVLFKNNLLSSCSSHFTKKLFRKLKTVLCSKVVPLRVQKSRATPSHYACEIPIGPVNTSKAIQKEG